MLKNDPIPSSTMGPRSHAAMPSMATEIVSGKLITISQEEFQVASVETTTLGWRDGSVVKSIDCFSDVLSSIPTNHMVALNHL